MRDRRYVEEHGESTGGLVAGSLMASLLAAFALPPLFGPLALWLGYRVLKKGSDLGVFCMGIAVMATIVGIWFGIWLWAQLA